MERKETALLIGCSCNNEYLVNGSEHNTVLWHHECQLLDLCLPVSVFKKVKCTLVQKLRLCTGCTAHRGSRCIALLFHDHGTRRGWEVSVMPRPLFTPENDPVPIVQEAGWAPGLVWKGAENLTTTGIWSPEHPARSQSLYRLSYPDHVSVFATSLIYVNAVRPTFQNTLSAFATSRSTHTSFAMWWGWGPIWATALQLFQRLWAKIKLYISE